MRKMLAVLCLVLLSGCMAKSEGEAALPQSNGEVRAQVELENGTLKQVSIDETQNGISKKEAKEDYGLKSISLIQKEWYEQIAFLEDYILENGVDALTFDDQGRAQNADVLSGCTISIEKYIEAYQAALEDAQGK